MSSETSKTFSADVLVRLRLKEIGLEVPHLIVAVTPDGQVVLRSNVSPNVLRSFGEDLKTSLMRRRNPAMRRTDQCSAGARDGQSLAIRSKLGSIERRRSPLDVRI